ncbi:unnamed protein product, partial [Meganyctiphanes norvegica]
PSVTEVDVEICFRGNVMDLTAFSQDSFDPKAWINNVFKSQEAQQNRDQYASSLVMRLQLAIQEVHNSLEENSQQVVNSLPRVVRDIESLGHEVSVLKNQMNSVRQDIEKVEKNTASSMETLVKLDSLKGRLVASSQALREADNWTTLSQDIEEVMDSGDIVAIAEKLVALQSCLTILTHVPDYQDRCAHLEGLKVRLEALASPYIVAAFTQHNLEESIKYSSMLRSLGREDQLETYYHKCEISQLCTAWRSSVEGYQMSGPPTWITSFLDNLFNLISQQVKWCSQVFVDCNPSLMLSVLTGSVLRSLEPSMSQVIAVAAKQQEEPLTFLITIRNAINQFIKDFQTVLGTAKPEDTELWESQRLAITSVLEPLKDQVGKYQEYEEALLLSHLISAELVRTDLGDTVQRLREYCGKLGTQSEEAANRCVQLTNGWSFPALLKALTTYVEQFVSRLNQAVRHVEQNKANITDDWTVFTTCLNLIHAAGELLMSVDGIEHSMATIFTNNAAKIVWSDPVSPAIPTPDLLITKPDIDHLKLLLNRVIEEDGRVLESSLVLCQDQCRESVDVALSTIMAPVASQLTQVPQMTAWSQGSNSQLSVSFSPQEYVTEIGQYLMTLPQHLEPLLVSHSPALNRALQEANTATGDVGGRLVSESEISAADFLINSVGQQTCKFYTEAIRAIPHVAGQPMVTQLTTDIDYVCNILEDLGVASCDPLDSLNTLLKAPADTYWQVAPGHNPRLIATVRQMRNIPPQS